VLNEEIALSPHNEILADDTLGVISLSREWRPIVASALEFWLASANRKDEISLDNDDLLSALIEDLYSYETVGASVKITPVQITLAANRASNSATYADVPDASHVHQFTFPNARIAFYNISGSNSGATNDNFVRPHVNSGTIVLTGEGIQNGTTARELACSATYAGLPTDTTSTITLQFRRTAGTFTILQSMTLLLEIVEWQ